MRRMLTVCSMLVACGGSVDDPAPRDDCDGICAEHATCERDAAGAVEFCICDPGYEGDGVTCSPQ
jgi:hypothetical protein